MPEQGAFITLIGPDGVGKTSVAAELVARTSGHYFHFRPPLSRRWTTPMPGETIVAEMPGRTGPLLSALRVAKAFVTFWLGYLISVRPEVNSGGFVVADRWAYGYLVHPRKLGVSNSSRLTEVMLGAMPQPDIVFALVADPMTIHTRKQELSPQQAAEEVAAWASLPVRQLIQLDANKPVGQIVDDILHHLESN